MRNWLIQVSPAQYESAWWRYTPSGSFQVKQHLKKLQPGDNIAIWVSGKDSGVFFLGLIDGELEDVDGPLHHNAPDGPQGMTAYVPVAYTHRLLDDVIPRAELKDDPRFENSLILRMSGGKNPFPMTDEEWAAVAERAEPRARVDAPSSDFPVLLSMLLPSTEGPPSVDDFRAHANLDRLLTTWVLQPDGGKDASGETPLVSLKHRDPPPTTTDAEVVVAFPLEATSATEAARKTWLLLDTDPAQLTLGSIFHIEP